jgi:hypothetical protein
VLVRPTAAGRAAWDRYIFEGMAREQQLLRALSLEELSQLNALLRKVMLTSEICTEPPVMALTVAKKPQRAKVGRWNSIRVDRGSPRR